MSLARLDFLILIQSRSVSCDLEEPAGFTGADEKLAVLASFEVDESAFSVARQFCDGDGRNALALASF